MTARGELRPEWLRAVLPLGVGAAEAWRPLGVGTLLLEQDVLWLATPSSVIAQAEGAPLVTWPLPNLGLRLDDAPDAGLAWLPHATYDLAVRPFPADPGWGLRAFKLTQCAAPATLVAGQPCLSAGFAYALASGRHLAPTVLGGALASIEAEDLALVTSAPMLPQCLGSPLLLDARDAQALCGLLVKRVWLQQDEAGDLPRLGLTVALSSAALVGLIRSPAALALARRAREADAARAAEPPGRPDA